MTYNSTIKFLYNLKGSEEKGKGYNLDLANIKKLLNNLGNPEKDLKVIHIAGTNGKGSVAAMLSSILSEKYKVGLYTSPHLVDFRERFQINGNSISKKDLIKYFNKVKPQIKGQTFFEVVTALAFLYFKEKNIDYLILEVGLGGRLDATNVVNPLLSIITNISLEHTNLLGETVEEIAFEKGGIIKKNKPVVTGATGSALKTIKKVAEENHAKLYLSKKFKKTNGKFSINGHKNLKLNLKGDFQIENATLAVSAIDILNDKYNFSMTESQIKNALKKIKWPGRFEFIEKNVLVDCAHNPAAIQTLRKEIEKSNYKNITLIFGILKDKDYKKMLSTLTPIAKNIILTKPSIDRARDPKDLSKILKKEHAISPISKALKVAKTYNGDLILVTGSIYTVGEIK